MELVWESKFRTKPTQWDARKNSGLDLQNFCQMIQLVHLSYRWTQRNITNAYDEFEILFWKIVGSNRIIYTRERDA